MNAARNPMGTLRDLTDSLLAVLWPDRCAACRTLVRSSTARPFEESVFCSACAGSLVEVTSPSCSCCGVPFGGTGPDHLCGDCLGEPPLFSRAWAPYVYGGALADAVVRFKYRRNAELSRQLGSLLAAALTKSQGTVALGWLGEIDAVVPVPLHRSRLWSRGFNQSALLARHAALAIERPLETRALTRVRATLPQAGLGRAARLENLRGAFVAKPRRLEGKRILLVDDVITTATTLREASRALRNAGAQSVCALSLARAEHSGVVFPAPVLRARDGD